MDCYESHILVCSRHRRLVRLRRRVWWPKNQKSAFVCNINTLTAEERKDLSETIDRLLTVARSGHELPNGYEIRFDDSRLFPAAAKWLEYEHRCCSFFDITISLTRNKGPMIVRLTGEKGVKEFLAADLPKLKELASGKH